MQARAKALAEDEKNLAILINSCPSYKSIGLPQGPSQFHKYLDEELLARHDLLIPSHYFPQQIVHSSAIQGFYTAWDMIWGGGGMLRKGSIIQLLYSKHLY